MEMSLQSLLLSNRPLFLRSWLAELIGTFALFWVVLHTPSNVGFLAAGATVLVMVVALGKVSGAQLNPSVTLALVTARKFSPVDGLAHVVAQLLGALLAVVATSALGGPLPSVHPGAGFFWYELAGAALLTFTVVRVTVHEVPEAGSALAIGTALAIGAMTAGPHSGGVLNPAIALSMLGAGILPGSAANILTYVGAPILAGAAAGWVGSYLGPVRVPDADPRRSEHLAL